MRLEFLRPRFWPTWLGLSLMRGVELLPVPLQRRVGAGLGFFIRHLPIPYVRIARRNIELCLPALSAAEREDLLDRHFRSLGLAVCETAMTWWSGDSRVSALADVQGLEHLQAALELGHGAILLGGHFTTLELTTRMLGTLLPLNIIFRPSKNALLTEIMFRNFQRHGKPIAYDDIRAMVRALKRNEPVWYAADQSYRNKGAAMVNFFGIPAATNTATSRLARISGAPVMTYFPQRLASGRYRIVISAPLENFPGPDPVEDTQRLNGLLERQILEAPEQYLWVHRRFKGLSADYPNYYGSDARKPAAATAEPNL